MISVKEAQKSGIPRWKLAQMVASGEIVRIARGVYADKDFVADGNFEIEVLARRGVEFVVALESALRVHDFTSAIPHELCIAMKRGARKPEVGFPLKVVRVDELALKYGAEPTTINGCEVKVYSAAKTVADLFKFRRQVGMEVALEALKNGLRRKLFTVDQLLEAAKVDRVQQVIMPYLEGMFA